MKAFLKKNYCAINEIIFLFLECANFSVKIAATAIMYAIAVPMNNPRPGYE